MVARFASLVLVSALLAGCAVEEPPSGSARDAAAGEADDATQAGQQGGQASSQPEPAGSAPHGQFKRQESAVTVTREGTQYVARKTVTFTNGMSGYEDADVALDTGSGGAEAVAWGQGGYRVVASLSGRGMTEADARQQLGQTKATHTDKVVGERIALSTAISGPGGGGLVASLPSTLAYRLDLESGSGGITVEDLRGPSLTASAGSGGVEVEGDFSTATFSTGSGGIEVSGRFATLRAIAGSGSIAADLTPSASGKYTLEAGSGGVDLALATGGSIGYDIEGSAGSGGVDIDVPGTSEVGTQTRSHGHVRTDGYDGKAIRCIVVAETGSGGITVSG